jgi:hypothetical protein
MTPFMRCQILFCLLFVVAAGAAKTVTLSGRVVDHETGTGLPAVSIAQSGSGVKATTDQKGDFSFSIEASRVLDSIGRMQGNILLIKHNGQLLDLKSAPLVTSVALYNLKGERLLYRERQAGSDMLPLTGLPANIYMMRITMRDGNASEVKWVKTGAPAVFTPGAPETRSGALPRQMNILAALSFAKQGYQTRDVDVNGDSATATMLVKMKPDIGFGVFDEDSVRSYRLYFAGGDLARLLDFSDLVPKSYTVTPVFVPARLICRGRTIDSVAVRFRGDQSLWDCVSGGKRKKNIRYPQFGFGNADICAKFSMKIDFNRYNKDNRLCGLKALNFRSMSADPTKMHEKLGYSVFSDMGIASPRSAYARLFVNDTLWGLFGITEEIDGRFTKSRYPKSGDGNLYKDLWPDANASDAKILEALVTNNDSGETPDIADFKALRDAVNAAGTDSTNFRGKIAPLVDIPYLVRYILVDRGIMNFDGLMSLYEGGMRHNYSWYHEDESKLFRLIPWDLDKIFIYPEPNFWTNNAPSGKNTVPNWNVVNSSYADIRCYFDPGSGGGSYKVSPIDKDKLLRLFRSATWSDFRVQGKAFLDSVLTENRLNARIGKWRTLIAGAVGEDPTVDSTEWAGMVDSLSHTIPLLRTNLKMMMDTLIVH